MAEAAAMEDLAKSAADRDVGASAVAAAAGVTETEKKRNTERKKGVISRIWRGMFGSRNEDYEKRLQYLSRAEASVHARMKRRAMRSRKMARNIILLSVIAQVGALAVAIMALKSIDLDLMMKIVRSSPVILLPGFSFLIYTTVVRFGKMLDRKDEKTLERLRAERKEKIDELKERTNYYTTQQLIQRYDLDPTAKAAAASILATKLGIDSGLNVYLGDGPNAEPSSAKSDDVNLGQSNGLRNRRQSHSQSDSLGSRGTPRSPSEVHNEMGPGSPPFGGHGQMVVEHHQGPGPGDGGWIGRIAALLVGEDPSQSYALICGNCYKHNGLARKEDYAHITYYCPHCNALNMSKSDRELSSGDVGTLLRDLSNASSAAGSEITSVSPIAIPVEETEQVEDSSSPNAASDSK